MLEIITLIIVGISCIIVLAAVIAIEVAGDIQDKEDN